MNIKYLSTYILVFTSGLFITLAYANSRLTVADDNFSDQFMTEMVTDNIYIIHGSNEDPTPANRGFINNPGFVITNSGVILIDPGSTNEIGEIVLKRVGQITPLPIVAIFNTHEHGDHWLANQTILKKYPGIPIYAHPNMMTSIKNGAGTYWLDLMKQLTQNPLINTQVQGPTYVVKDNDEIVFDNLTFKIHHYGVSHTNNDVMIEIVELKTLFLGDNVLNKRMPHLDDGDIVGNISTVNKALELNCRYFIPGHGAPGLESLPREYLAYLTQLYELVKHYYHEDMTDFEMKEPIEAAMSSYSDWSGFDKELGRQISLVYLQVERDDF